MLLCLSKDIKNAKEKISKNEPFFVNDALDPNDPFITNFNGDKRKKMMNKQLALVQCHHQITNNKK